MFFRALSLPGWREAMIEEMNTLDYNSTLNLVNLPAIYRLSRRLLYVNGCFIVKFNDDGSIAHLKARLMSKRFAQTYGEDYFVTFSPVAMLLSIPLLISMVTTHD